MLIARLRVTPGIHCLTGGGAMARMRPIKHLEHIPPGVWALCTVLVGLETVLLMHLQHLSSVRGVVGSRSSQGMGRGCTFCGLA